MARAFRPRSRNGQRRRRNAVSLGAGPVPRHRGRQAAGYGPRLQRPASARVLRPRSGARDLKMGVDWGGSDRRRGVVACQRSGLSTQICRFPGRAPIHSHLTPSPPLPLSAKRQAETGVRGEKAERDSTVQTGEWRNVPQCVMHNVSGKPAPRSGSSVAGFQPADPGNENGGGCRFCRARACTAPSAGEKPAVQAPPYNGQRLRSARSRFAGPVPPLLSPVSCHLPSSPPQNIKPTSRVPAAPASEATAIARPAGAGSP